MRRRANSFNPNRLQNKTTPHASSRRKSNATERDRCTIVALTDISPEAFDVAIVGAGAAGLAAAIFTRRLNPSRRVLLLDGAKRPGAKILVSGGSRCNVTNASVADTDFWGGRPSIVRRILRGFTVPDTIAFFDRIGVRLHEEAGGKLFPDSNRARDVLEALLREAREAGVDLRADHRVFDVVPASPFRIVTSRGEFLAAEVVLATGGRSLPKTGSDGAGFEIAQRLGHSLTPTTPGLVPLVLSPGKEERGGFHRELSGVSHDVELALWIDGSVAVRIQGSLLWTHFGISGPAALDMSRHWLRAVLEGRGARLTANFCPGLSFDDLERRWAALASARPKALVQTVLATLVPSSVAAAILGRLTIDASTTLAHFPREERRRLVQSLVQWHMPVTGSRGYNFAEVTAGGVPLEEIDPATMESRIRPGLFLIGEILDVDGRIGGFNFQWAWSSARVAATALAGPHKAGSSPRTSARRRSE